MSKMHVDENSAEIPSDALEPGTDLLHGQYTIESFLNAGGFGITYLARDSLERIVVIKECFPSTMCCRTHNVVRARSRANQDEFSSVVSLFGQEARRLSKLTHPHIVGIHQVFEDNETAYMALDYVQGYDLMDTIEHIQARLEPRDVKAVVTKLLGAVAYIHSHDILHRDISPDNILMDADREPILIDFGAAREEATRASRILSAIHVVKDGYSPQEFYLAGSEQNASSDLYSLAATFYHVITGKTPPNAQRRVAAIASGKDDPYVPLSSRTIPGYDEFFLSAIDIAMNVFPQDRLQGADEWIERIDTVKRRSAKLVEAQNDKKLESSISLLVAETNEAVANSPNSHPNKPQSLTTKQIEARPISLRRNSKNPELRSQSPDFVRARLNESTIPIEPEVQTNGSARTTSLIPPCVREVVRCSTFLYFSGGRDRTLTWDTHRNADLRC